MLKKIISLFIITSLLSCTQLISAPLNQIIAVVNDSIITQSAFETALMAAKQQIAQAGAPMPDEQKLKKQVLAQLIYQKLQLQLAKRNNITASETEVNDAIARIAAQNHITPEILSQKLAEENMPFSLFKKRIRQQIIITKLERQAIGGNISVSKAEIAAFRLKQANQATANTANTNTQYHLATILIPLPESPTETQVTQAESVANGVYKTAQTEKNFAELMAQYPGSSDLDWRSLNDLPELFTAIVTQLHAGEVAKPIRAPNGFHVVKLLGVRQQPQQSQQPTTQLTDQQIQMFLYQQKFQKKLQPWLKQLEKSAYIKIYRSTL